MIRVTTICDIITLDGDTLRAGTTILAVEYETTVDLFNECGRNLVRDVPLDQVIFRPKFYTADGINFTESLSGGLPPERG